MLQYDIQTSGIRFYPATNTDPSITAGSLFTLLDTVTAGGRTITAVSGSGSVNLVLFTAVPQDTFHAVTLEYLPGTIPSFTLKVAQSTPFAHRANIFFQALELTFTEVQSGAAFKMAGGVQAIVFDATQAIPLVAEFTDDSRLVFRYKGGLSAPLAIAQLGMLELTVLEVGAQFDTLNRSLSAHH